MPSKLDRLVWKELWGPFWVGVGMFAMLLFAGGMLVRITEWIVAGVDPMRIGELTLMFVPAIMVKTIGMATLLSALLAFGRLSRDSEIVALKAAGISLYRIMQPVALFCFGLAIAGFAINETTVPWASERANALQIELRRDLDKGKAQRNINRTISLDNGAFAFLNALDFSLEKQTLIKASLLVYNEKQIPVWLLQADELQYYGPSDWRVRGKAELQALDGSTRIQLDEGVWPEQIENPAVTPKTLLAGFTSDLDVFSMAQLREQVNELKKEPKPDMSQISNLEFGFWNKITGPMAAIVFGLLGAPLGIRNQRTGAGAGFAISIGLTFAYLMLANFMAVYSRGGAIPPIVASFTPLIIGIVAAVITIARSNG